MKILKVENWAEIVMNLRKIAETIRMIENFRGAITLMANH